MWFWCIVDPDKPNSRKTLATGSIPTENLPKCPWGKTPRRVLVRKTVEKDDDMPSTSSALVDSEVETIAEQQISIDDIKAYAGRECLEPWESDVKDDIG